MLYANVQPMHNGDSHIIRELKPVQEFEAYAHGVGNRGITPKSGLHVRCRPETASLSVSIVSTTAHRIHL